MTHLRKLDRDRLQGELSSIQKMLANIGQQDVVFRMGLEDRVAELDAELNAIGEVPDENLASAALFFGGAPVVGSIGIESEFGSKAVSIFQDLVAKQLAHESVGLGQRGVVPNRSAARMHITNVVRGSFGFVLEELNAQRPLLDTALKSSVDAVAGLIAAFGDDEEARFEEAVSEVDERVLATAKDFFGLMRQSGATFRIVVGERDHSFQISAIERAEKRATTTTVNDHEEKVGGVFSVALPESHLFEFRTLGERGTIKGRVDKKIDAQTIVEINRNWMEKSAVGVFKVRRLLKDGVVARETFTLLSLEEAAD